MDISSGHLATGEAQKEKFDLGRGPLPADLSAGLPESYGDNRLVMMARDPFWFFCYWEFTPERLSGLRQAAGQDAWEMNTLILRVYDITDRKSDELAGCPFIDVEVSDKQARKWYVKVDRSGRLYQIELGLRLKDGRFVSFLSSNRVQMPFGKISDQTDSRFMAVSVGAVQEEWQKFQDIAGNLSSMGRGSSELSKSMAQRWEFLKSVFSGSSSWMNPSSGSSPGRWQNGVSPSDEKKP